MHSTDYTNAFIAVADDCKSDVGKSPTAKPEKTVAQLQYEMISAQPYQYTSDEVIFAIYAAKNGVEPAEWEAKRAAFFAKGQPCLRSSPLGKTYGWGIHFDQAARVAILRQRVARVCPLATGLGPQTTQGDEKRQLTRLYSSQAKVYRFWSTTPAWKRQLPAWS